MAFYTINLDLDETWQDPFGCLKHSDTETDDDDVNVDILVDPDVEFKGKKRAIRREYRICNRIN